METIKLKVKFEEKDSFKLKWNTEEENFKADFGVFTKITNEPYVGVTDVTPAIESQVLNTKDKVVYSDITVREIPFESVSNLSGGYTATIGGY